MVYRFRDREQKERGKKQYAYTKKYNSGAK
jgi:hypothetical protein